MPWRSRNHLRAIAPAATRTAVSRADERLGALSGRLHGSDPRGMSEVNGTTSLTRIQQISPAPIIISVVTWADCLVAIQQRQVEAISTDDTILAGLASQDPFLHIVGPSMADEPYGVGINLDNTGMVRFVNGTLERIRRDGTWNTLYRKWLTVLGPAPAPPTARYVD